MTKFEDLSDFDKTVLLVYTNDMHRGPGMVVKNLQKGLEAIGVRCGNTFQSMPSKYIGVTQFCHPELLNEWYRDKETLLLGPNLFVLPTDNPSLCQMFDNFVVPSQWVKELYEGFELMRDKDINVWSVGIDTAEWGDKKLAGPSTPKYDCFIYHKNRSDQDLAIVEAVCRKFGLKYQTLKYGEYQEHELKTATQESRFAILCTGTESQGIAYMQVLSTDTPCYVFNSPTWKSEDGHISVAATSIPYWDSRCGYTSDLVDLKHFEEFLAKVDLGVFIPRKYILENHTLEKSAQVYYNLLRACYNDETVQF